MMLSRKHMTEPTGTKKFIFERTKNADKQMFFYMSTNQEVCNFPLKDVL